MTSGQIKAKALLASKHWFEMDYKTKALLGIQAVDEIALQLAKLNEHLEVDTRLSRALFGIYEQFTRLNIHHTRMEARYLALTDKALRRGNQKSKVKRQKAKGPATHNS